MLNTDLKIYLPKTVSNDATNGGRMSTNLVTSGVVQNVWPHVPRAERTSGSKKYRKLFCKAADDADGTLIAPQYWLDDITAGSDWFTMFAGTMTDTLADIAGWETGADTKRKYGVARIKTNITAGTKTIVLQLESSTLGTGSDKIIFAGDTVRLTDKTDPTAVSGNEEFLTVDTVSVADTEMTVVVVQAIANSYTTTALARLMSVYEPGDVSCGSGTPVVTSSAGTVDNSVYPPLLDNIGTIEQTITLTFTDAANFTATSNVAGVTLTSGNVSTAWSPVNSSFSKPYLTLEVGFFGGTFTAGDTVEITTHPAAVAIWEKRVVPAGAASMSNNKITLVTAGESA